MPEFGQGIFRPAILRHFQTGRDSSDQPTPTARISDEIQDELTLLAG